MGQAVNLAVRTYARYAAPLTAIAIVLYAPLLAYGWLSKTPTELGPGWRMVMTAWGIASTAWILQYMLVGAAAPLARSIEAAAPLSQLAAVRTIVRGFLRSVLPVLIVVAAVVLGSIALAIPGLVLGVLLSLTGASERSGLSEPLLDSVERVRANLKRTILAVVGILALDFAIVAIPFAILLGPLSAKPTLEELATAQLILRITVIGVPLVTPLAACVLAAIATARSTAPAQPAPR